MPYMNIFACIIALIVSTAMVTAFTPRMHNQQYRSVLSMISGGRKPLMGGNWKLNPTTLAKAKSLASEVVSLTKDVKDVDVVIFPPHPYLLTVYEKVSNSGVKVGGQNCYFETEGAYTGAVSTCMLKDIGISYVLCGHSERRTLFKEDDGAISRKVKKVLKEGLKPVLCFGESREEYEAGLNHEVCAVQLLKDLKEVTPEEMVNTVLAYEPVWAIGTGLVCPPEVAQEVHSFVRSLIAKKYGATVANKVIIQYGGSVKPDNVKELMAMPDIDGCLVGGASLTADSFAKIVSFNTK